MNILVDSGLKKKIQIENGHADEKLDCVMPDML